jgi:hypothetical protein
MRSGPLIRTVHPLLTTSPHPITQGRVGGTASHAVNIFLLTQTLSRIGDTAPSLPHQPHRRMTSPPPAAAQHHLHLSPRCCTTHHILLVGLPGSSKWPPLCTTLPILQSLSITHGCLTCTTHWPPPCSSARVSTDCWIRQSGSLHHKVRRFPKAGSDLKPVIRWSCPLCIKIPGIIPPEFRFCPSCSGY